MTSWSFVAIILGLPVAGLILAYLFRRLESQERIAAIEKGLPTEPHARDVASRIAAPGSYCSRRDWESAQARGC